MYRLYRFSEKLIVRWIEVNRELPSLLAITNSCNLNCTHCYHSHQQNDDTLNLNQLLSVLDQYKQLIVRMGYKPYVILCGSEPFTRPLIVPFLSDLLKSPIKYETIERMLMAKTSSSIIGGQ